MDAMLRYGAFARTRQTLMHRRPWKRTPLRLIYRRLLRAFGPQGWWPASSPFEMMVGGILTQATNWHNVEQAIERLRRAGGLSPRRLLAMPRERLERAVRSAGYFRQKTQRLTVFSRWYVTRYAGSRARMFRTPWRALREELLALHGIGPETADSMLLYAGGQPVFVVDAYTIRVFRRHRLIGAGATYDGVQRFAMRELSPIPRRTSLARDRGERLKGVEATSTTVYNEFHALLVAVGKRFCHRQHPDCEHCPLGDLPHSMR